MPSRKKIETRERNARTRKAAFETANRVRETAARALSTAQLVVADPGFAERLCSAGIETVPVFLVPQTRDADADRGRVPGNGKLDRVSLQFVVVWRFFYPLFSNSEVIAYLEKSWPGFAQDMKDAFIALVVEGPFPHAMSGHRGRRHGTAYQPGIRHGKPNKKR